MLNIELGIFLNEVCPLVDKIMLLCPVGSDLNVGKQHNMVPAD